MAGDFERGKREMAWWHEDRAVDDNEAVTAGF
jgi:hypothetical protein